MNKIISFEDFSQKASELTEDDLANVPTQEGAEEGGEQYYMFFQNLKSMKHYIDEIMAFTPEQVDELLKGGHDWAADHIAVSKDDLQEVAEWLRNELGSEEGHQESPEPMEVEEPENITVDIEGSNDEVEVEGGEGGEEEEEDDDDDSEEE